MLRLLHVVLLNEVMPSAQTILSYFFALALKNEHANSHWCSLTWLSGSPCAMPILQRIAWNQPQTFVPLHFHQPSVMFYSQPHQHIGNIQAWKVRIRFFFLHFPPLFRSRPFISTGAQC